MGGGCGNGCLGTQGKTRDEAVTWTASNERGGYEGGTSLVRWVASMGHGLQFWKLSVKATRTYQSEKGGNRC